MKQAASALRRSLDEVVTQYDDFAKKVLVAKDDAICAVECFHHAIPHQSTKIMCFVLWLRKRKIRQAAEILLSVDDPFGSLTDELRQLITVRQKALEKIEYLKQKCSDKINSVMAGRKARHVAAVCSLLCASLFAMPTMGGSLFIHEVGNRIFGGTLQHMHRVEIEEAEKLALQADRTKMVMKQLEGTESSLRETFENYFGFRKFVQGLQEGKIGDKEELDTNTGQMKSKLENLQEVIERQNGVLTRLRSPGRPNSKRRRSMSAAIIPTLDHGIAVDAADFVFDWLNIS